LAEALKNPDLFRDLSNSKAAAALARSAVELAAKSNSEGAKGAHKNFQRLLALGGKAVETFLDMGGSNGEGAGAKRDLDPTLAGGLLNSNPDVSEDGRLDSDESSSEPDAEGADSGDEDAGGDSGDEDKLEMEFVEEQS
jgi:hypothetical protein